ncbi:MAG: DUF1223 domain-containing protein [Verrucomicrobiota bacterium]|nr:DUF1223 domain-containing protein [Verrucomicrobiota bacterium]
MRTHLLELFTSEGCSSCPPAEAWLSKLKDDPGLWRDFVPLAFHVDYWDRLGWRDPFASKVWTSRQYEYSARWKSSNVTHLASCSTAASCGTTLPIVIAPRISSQ